jgi:N-carbamoyl-L-amino-acid hydrolase
MPLAAVTGIFGISWQEVRFLGPGGHSGTVPVARRRDPALALARLVEAVNRLGLEGGEDARATVGRLSVSPGSINSIASEAVAYVEFRSPDPQGLKSLESSLSEAVRGIAGGLSLGFGTEGIFRQEPVAFDPGAVRAVERAAGILGLGCRRMASGAGHDAGKLAGLAPTAMIFIPCHGGLSHVPQEGITAKWAEDGANALLLCLLEKAMG